MTSLIISLIIGFLIATYNQSEDFLKLGVFGFFISLVFINIIYSYNITKKEKISVINIPNNKIKIVRVKTDTSLKLIPVYELHIQIKDELGNWGKKHVIKKYQLKTININYTSIELPILIRDEELLYSNKVLLFPKIWVPFTSIGKAELNPNGEVQITCSKYNKLMN